MKNGYFFLLSAMLGIELFIGICVAPILFFPAKFSLDVPLTLAQSGMLMSEIFVKLGYILIAISAFGVLYSFWNQKKLLFCLACIILILAGLFVFYFTPIILQAQSLGATDTQDFQQIHRLSEHTIKVIAFLQGISLFLLGNLKFRRSKDF